MSMRAIAVLSVLVVSAGCSTSPSGPGQQTFSSDVAFMEKHTETVVLKDDSGKSQVLVLPQMQGRVMTSTAEGSDGYSFGWINRDFIASGKLDEHMNAYGGEDRFWIGPEGGQFSIFFKKDVPFDLTHWHTPAPIDNEPWEVVGKSSDAAALQKTMRLENYSGTVFDVRVDRQVRVLGRDEALKMLGVNVDRKVSMVAYESGNKMTNTGKNAWAKESGLLSIWILGMFTPSPQTTIVVPFVKGPEGRLGPIVNDTYFGKVPADRLVVRDGVLFFSGDGQYRSKIGLTPMRARDTLGSYDAANKALTIVQYNKPREAHPYVNSMWELQKEPYAGDAVNSYNDGPASPGAKPMGPFYELETSSPAAALLPGESVLHTHRTFHFRGPEAQLNAIAQATLGVTIEQIESALP